MLYLITYDLKDKEHGNYSRLYESIKSCGHWCHYLDSTWIVKSSMTEEKIFDRLSLELNSKDYILIFDITNKDYWGALPQSAWDWIKENING